MCPEDGMRATAEEVGARSTAKCYDRSEFYSSGSNLVAWLLVGNDPVCAVWGNVTGS